MQCLKVSRNSNGLSRKLLRKNRLELYSYFKVLRNFVMTYSIDAARGRTKLLSIRRWWLRGNNKL